MADKKNAKGKKKDRDAKDKSKAGKRASKQGVTPPRPAPAPVGDGDADPPIIISGGSVTIESAVFLTTTFDPVKNKFIYENRDVKIGMIKTKGKKDQQDDSDNGKFSIELFKA